MIIITKQKLHRRYTSLKVWALKLCIPTAKSRHSISRSCGLHIWGQLIEYLTWKHDWHLTWMNHERLFGWHFYYMCVILLFECTGIWCHHEHPCMSFHRWRYYLGTTLQSTLSLKLYTLWCFAYVYFPVRTFIIRTDVLHQWNGLFSVTFLVKQYKFLE